MDQKQEFLRLLEGTVSCKIVGEAFDLYDGNRALPGKFESQYLK